MAVGEQEYAMSSVSSLLDDNGTRPFIAIAVLVCGVIGGLIMVISFIFFCKYCFKKRQPLASTVQGKREEEVVVPKSGKQARGSVSAAASRRGYEVLSGANAVVHPVPADLESYLQQPASAENNNAAVPPDLAVGSTSLVGGGPSKKSELLQKKLTKLAEEQLLIVQTEIAAGEDEYDEDATLAQVSDSNLVSAGGANEEDYPDLFLRVGHRRPEKSDRSQPPSKKPSSSSQGAAREAALAAVSGQQGSPHDFGNGVFFDGRQRSASSVPSRQHRHKQVGRRVDTLAVVSGEDGRRRSLDERLSIEQASQRRRLPVAVGADYYASEYDRKHGPRSGVPATATSVDYSVTADQRSRRHPQTALSVPAPVTIDYQQVAHRPQRSPIAHLPRSHQMIVDKTSPPPVQQQSSTSSTNGIVTEAPSKMYARDHRNAVSYGAAEQDFSVSEKNMYARGHRLAFSFTDTGAERTLPPPPPHMVQQRDVVGAAAVSPDGRSTDIECASFSSAFEYESLEKFCRECRAVFQAAANAATTTTSSSSSGQNQHKRNGPLFPLPHQRQAKSLDVVDAGRRSAVQQQRQTHSLDTTCVACMNDALNRLALLGSDGNVNLKLQSYAAVMGSLVGAQSPATTAAFSSSAAAVAILKRQLTLIESAAGCVDETDLMHLDDAQSEQVKVECKQLWQLRSVFESEPGPETTLGGTVEGMIVIDDEYEDPMAQQSLDAEELETGATTSYTTSFESNTEPITVEDYLRSRPSGPYLEPPRLSVEAKRQKLRSLYARRQMQLQQQGASIESYESVDTIESSSSGKPELILTSTESNQEQTGAQSGTIVARPTATEQQQTSFSFDSSVGGDADSQAAAPVIVATRPSVVRGSDYLTPSPSMHRQRLEAQSKQQHTRHTPSRERRAVEAFFDVVAASGNGAYGTNGTETDCSRSDIQSGDSFDDSAVAAAVVSNRQSMPPPPPPPFANVHLFRMRRQYETGMSGVGGPLGHRFPPPAPPPPQLRDYCVDPKTEAIFQEFVRHDPRLEAPTVRGHGRRRQARRFQYHFASGGASYDNDSAVSNSSGGRGKLTQENSIDEDPQHFASASAGPAAPSRYEIPVIRLPEDEVAPSSQHRPPSHQLTTAMAAKG